MKKLLSALFILGSITMLAEDLADRPGEGGNPECYTSACKVEKDFEVKVKVPEQLKITKVDNIDLGLWCGTKAIHKEGEYQLEGQKGAKVDVSVTPVIEFKKHNSNTVAFTGNLELVGGGNKTLSSPSSGSGKATGKIKASLAPTNNKLEASTTYTAKATLVAEYDI
ncbi:MAG: hypothetical protein ACRDB6_07595 [Cetobacterium sp.]